LNGKRGHFRTRTKFAIGLLKYFEDADTHCMARLAAATMTSQ